ncbi:MAG: hypothetical protein V1826_03115 [bacterium]
MGTIQQGGYQESYLRDSGEIWGRLDDNRHVPIKINSDGSITITGTAEEVDLGEMVTCFAHTTRIV